MDGAMEVEQNFPPLECVHSSAVRDEQSLQTFLPRCEPLEAALGSWKVLLNLLSFKV